MSEPQPEVDRSPRPNLIVIEPATVDACRTDYENGADVRARLDRQIKDGR